MIRFRNKVQPAFTLIEALIATFVMAIMLMPIFMLETNLLQSVAHSSRLMERMLHAHNFFIDARRATQKDKKKTLEKKITQPPTTLVYEIKPLSAESVFKKFKDMSMEQVTVQWQDGRYKRTETLVSFAYTPEAQEKA
jgi:type II secretory pathway pseudopilin PulG